MRQIDAHAAHRIEADIHAVAVRDGLPCEFLTSRFWFLRHGRTASNHAGLAQGQIDIELDDVGRAQARTAGVALRTVGLRRVVASDLRRASETAELAAQELGLGTVVLDPNLRERCFGALEGTPRIVEAWLATPPDGESIEAFTRRTLAAVASAASEPDVLVCAHGGTLRVLSAALGTSLDEGFHANALPLCFERNEDGWRCRMLGGYRQGSLIPGSGGSR